jgi:hypothetical protein
MRRQPKNLIGAVALVAPLVLAGCMTGPAYTGSFDRTLSVDGPVHLELGNGSGSALIRSGESGQVRIHAEVRSRTTFWGSARQRLEEVTKNPPVEQQGNTVRIGTEGERLRFISIDYTISVPADTEVRASIGSGNLEIRGIQGPLQATTGSGRITAADIRQQAQVTSGSGSIQLRDIGGSVRVTTGSGTIELTGIHGDIRGGTGSGRIRLEDAPGRVSVHTGSGSISVTGASGDLRAGTGSGSITIEGNPAVNSYWELQTGSGSVNLRVPSNASFRLYARTGSGRIQTNIPLMIEEQSRRELRARAGNGAARVDVRCSSGSIRVGTGDFD